jgi:hypothetical protein
MSLKTFLLDFYQRTLINPFYFLSIYDLDPVWLAAGSKKPKVANVLAVNEQTLDTAWVRVELIAMLLDWQPQSPWARQSSSVRRLRTPLLPSALPLTISPPTLSKPVSSDVTSIGLIRE